MARKINRNARNANHDRANLAIRTSLVDSLWHADPADIERIQLAIRIADSLGSVRS